MSENLRPSDVLQYSLHKPSPLPSPTYRDRLRGALQTYRVQKGKGWTWLYKNEISKCFSDEDIEKHPGLFDQLAFVRRLTYWCNERGDVGDSRFVYVITYYLSKYASEIIDHVFDDSAFIRTGRTLGKYFSVPPCDREKLLQERITIINRCNAGKRLTPGVYRVVMRAGDARLNNALFILTEVNEELFLKANLIEYQFNGSIRLINRHVGYYFPYVFEALLILKSSCFPENYIKGIYHLEKRHILLHEEADIIRYVATIGPVLVHNSYEEAVDFALPARRAYRSHLEECHDLIPEEAELIQSARMGL